MNVNRIIGQYHGHNDGPMLLFTAGIHGNELAGVKALKEVFEVLEKEKPSINGSIIGLAGNVKAIEQEVRFIDEDLNRVWLTEETDVQVSEHLEREELSKTMSEIMEAHKGEKYVFDLHATSSESTPFIMMSDTLRNRELSQFVGVPIVLGLLEHLMGMFIDVTSRCGFPTILFQGGGIDSEDTITHHLGLIWKTLKFQCGLDTSKIVSSDDAIKKLDAYAVTNKDEHYFEIIYSHKIKKNTEFEMNAGHLNFETIKKKEVLAHSSGKPIKATHSGQIFMPLYQKRGGEGFYIISPIAVFWINFSRKFRLFKYHDKLDWLLGVKKISNDPLTFRIDEQITFAWGVEIFHLLGYIKVRQEGPFLYMTRRENARNPATGEEAVEIFANRSYLRADLKNIKSDWKVPFSQKLEID
jgi:hypothetical protein